MKSILRSHVKVNPNYSKTYFEVLFIKCGLKVDLIMSESDYVQVLFTNLL